MLRLALCLLFCSAFYCGAAQAASYNCSEAATTKERLICSNAALSAADYQLGAAFTEALGRLPAGDRALLRMDERNWIKGVGKFCPIMAANNRDFSVTCLMRTYAYRISYLKTVGPQASSAQALNDADAHLVANSIQNALPLFLNGNGTIIDSIKKWKMLTPPIEFPFHSVNDLMPNFPMSPNGDVQEDWQRFTQAGGIINPFAFLWLPSAKVGGAAQSGGNAACYSWIVFASDGKNLTSAPLPGTFTTDLCATDGHFAYLGAFGDRAVAIYESDPAASISGASIGRVEVALQVWDGSDWSKTAAFTIDLSYPLNPTPVVSACPSETCSAVTKLGYEIARKFSRAHTAASISMPLNQSELVQFNAMQSAANFGDTMILPTLGKQLRYIGCPAFGPDSVVFPARLNGTLVLGRIGHGEIGWRVDTNWNIAFWRLEGTKLVPVGSVVFGLGAPILKSISDLPDWQPETH
nr:lysozyme inhibitor LprI family protein [uncultured Acidocella sp.]